MLVVAYSLSFVPFNSLPALALACSLSLHRYPIHFTPIVSFSFIPVCSLALILHHLLVTESAFPISVSVHDSVLLFLRMRHMRTINPIQSVSGDLLDLKLAHTFLYCSINLRTLLHLFNPRLSGRFRLIDFYHPP